MCQLLIEYVLDVPEIGKDPISWWNGLDFSFWLPVHKAFLFTSMSIIVLESSFFCSGKNYACSAGGIPFFVEAFYKY